MDKEKKMTEEDLRYYYERKGIIYGAIFALVILVIAAVGFYLGFNGIDLINNK